MIAHGAPPTGARLALAQLVLTDRWLKVFSVFYQLVGIGILVEVLRRLGLAFIVIRTQEKQKKQH